MKRLDLTNQVFGRLTVQSIASSTSWTCVCQCGRSCVVPTASLRSGNTKSCGCLRNEGPAPVHGMSDSPLYKIWSGMKKRCLNVNSPRFKDYGGRGITVCDRWLDFRNFVEDMPERPSEHHSLERKDNTLGYFKENCYWATPKDQANNTRRNYLVEYEGKTYSVAQLAEHVNMPYRKLYKRLRLGWPVSKAVTQ